MKKKVLEGTILFLSILKWFVLATLIGLVVGLSTTVFLKALKWSISATDNNIPYHYMLMPVAFFISIALVKYLAPDAKGHGTEKVIEAIHKNSGRINPLVVPIKLFATIITIASGGSAGKEGPCAQIGAGLSSLFSDIFRFNDTDRRKLVICGISAGFAAVFGTPISGAIFGVEVLVVGSIMYDVLLPSFIAGMTAFQVSSAFGIQYFYHPITSTFTFNEMFFIDILLAGIFFGLCSFLFIEILKFFESLSEKIRIWEPLKGLIGGLIIIALVFAFSKQYLGLGLTTIEDSLHGLDIIWYAFLLKMVFTGVTLSFGGSGGVITPIFFIGATSGLFFADVMHLDKITFAAIGMVSLLAGAANTPIAASIMFVELFGPKAAPYAAVACIISFLMTGYRSVYPAQKIGVNKSMTIDVVMGREMSNPDAHYKPEDEKMVNSFFKSMKIRKRKKRRKPSDK